MMFPLDAGLAIWVPWAAGLPPSAKMGSLCLISSPKTDMKEGICPEFELG